MDENKPSEGANVNPELHSSWVAHSESEPSHELPGPITNPEELLPSGDSAQSVMQSASTTPEALNSTQYSPEPTRNYKTFVLLGISLTLFACLVIGAIAYMTIFSKNKYEPNQITNVNMLPTYTPIANNSNPADFLKDVVMTSEDPTRPGVPVEKKTAFLKNENFIYTTVVLNKPAIGTKVSFVRYLNLNYIDHGTITIEQANTKYVHFQFERVNQKAIHPVGSYQLKIYINDTWVKTVDYTVS